MNVHADAGPAGAKDWVALAGRILIAALFVQAGFAKATGFAGTAGWIASVGLPMPAVATVRIPTACAHRRENDCGKARRRAGQLCKRA